MARMAQKGPGNVGAVMEVSLSHSHSKEPQCSWPSSPVAVSQAKGLAEMGTSLGHFYVRRSVCARASRRDGDVMSRKVVLVGSWQLTIDMECTLVTLVSRQLQSSKE